MAHEKTLLNDKIRTLNLQINSQLKRAGILDSKCRNIKKLSDAPDSDWKDWIADLIAHRDTLMTELNDQEQISWYVQKFDDKMQGSTKQTAWGWICGTGLDTYQRDEAWKQICGKHYNGITSL